MNTDQPPTSTVSPWITAVYNQKGGVGKTTTAANLAVCLAAAGAKVLLMDLDSQGNATTSLGATYNREPGAYDFIIGAQSFADTVIETDHPRLSLIPATRALAGLELELSELDHPQFVISGQLDAADLGPDGLAYDYVIIDCPPALGMVPVNALVACHTVLVPVQCEQFAHDGLVNALFSLKRIRSTFNPYLAVHGLLITMVGDDPVARDLEHSMRAEFADQVFRVSVPRDGSVSAATASDQTAVAYAPNAPAADAHIQLLEEFLTREQKMRLKFATLKPEGRMAVDALGTRPKAKDLLPAFAPDPLEAARTTRLALSGASRTAPEQQGASGPLGTEDDAGVDPVIRKQAEEPQKQPTKTATAAPEGTEVVETKPETWTWSEDKEPLASDLPGGMGLMPVTFAAAFVVALLMVLVIVFGMGLLTF